MTPECTFEACDGGRIHINEHPLSSTLFVLVWVIRRAPSSIYTSGPLASSSLLMLHRIETFPRNPLVFPSKVPHQASNDFGVEPMLRSVPVSPRSMLVNKEDYANDVNIADRAVPLHHCLFLGLVPELYHEPNRSLFGGDVKHHSP